MSKHAPPLLGLARVIDAVNARFGQACAWLTLFLVLGTAVVVVLRYGFGIGATALQEAVLYAHALVFMGAAAWVLQRNGHVRVDIFYQRFTPRYQALVEVLGTLLFLLPVCLFLGWASWDYVANSWATLEGSSESGGLKFVYLQKSIILVLVICLILQGLSEIIKAGYAMAGRLPEQEVKHG
ncbi:MAG TPA: permease [Pseudomonas sp.]|jgi:TRAP-type mannitol/chloroaromatic compound transport system permease small subunit|uniref:TRAP transporter small permease protein n=1 Tax=Stutzerimonas stutzeri TaxID=316 RepID=A0A5S5BCE3_STUST|nr:MULTISPECIES: TRAP transporter small permease subunit [Stutzerimonas]MBK57420.1 permease [Pseudomonas sp.]MBU0812568.1 TRAP transporter small permease subunit [Gammaproteobacteria bacterium]MBK3849480.1 TRAP transporter small permease subunit [Stutzerimonas xanthomarina]MBU0853621.1 TRAP transporter small permease subunit [Gammaproteobacteria bacterium]MBU1460267.1 TRAP transporter small permease subunit [Gammaproteobacteria bacterium]|tara:strand:- start:1938 stop:2483 length:546 start_codon:yes stop_codon:yes gene_type:complete